MNFTGQILKLQKRKTETNSENGSIFPVQGVRLAEWRSKGWEDSCAPADASDLVGTAAWLKR